MFWVLMSSNSNYGVKKLLLVNTDPGSETWASPTKDMSSEDYLSWLKESQGQMIMVLVRRLSLRVVKRADIKVSGKFADAFDKLMDDELLRYAKAMRDAGTERVPETGSLF